MIVLLKKGFKVCLAGLLAFLILSVFTTFYYNLPSHEESATLSTNHTWSANQWHARGTEGFSYGITDAKGFNNVTVPDEVNVLLMGSSQMEAFNVLPRENTSYLLGTLLEAHGYGMTTYNIGISGHDLPSCINNLGNAIEEFAPTDYVVIETLNYRFSPEQMCQAAAGTLHREDTTSNKIVSMLQKSSYLRLMYRQLSSFLKSRDTDATPSSLQLDNQAYIDALDTILCTAAQKMPADCRLVLVLDDALVLDENNAPASRTEDFYYSAFRDTCEKYGILFIDMRNSFADLYLQSHRFPHGFSNTRVGTGHLNKYGHQQIAYALYDVIAKQGGNS